MKQGEKVFSNEHIMTIFNMLNFCSKKVAILGDLAGLQVAVKIRLQAFLR